jgi:DNA-binding transcriptional ArsR family regulator
VHARLDRCRRTELKPYQDVTTSLAKALAHPLRSRLLSALEGRTSSPSELAEELGEPLGVVSYHVRRLHALGLVKAVKRIARRGAVEHYYTATSRPRITDEGWGSLPNVIREAMTKATLDEINSSVAAAAAGGGFDPSDIHLSRSPLTVDETGWRALSRELGRMTERIQKVEAESKKRLERTNQATEREATVVLMLFCPAPTRVAPLNKSDERRRSSARAR